MSTTERTTTSDPVVTETPAPGGRRRLGPAAVGVVAAGVVAGWALLQIGGGGPQQAPAGIPDPGALTGWAIPALDLVVHVAAVVVVACLLVPVLVSVRLGDDLGRTGRRAVRTAALAGAVWIAAVLAQGVFTVSDLFALPVTDLDYATVSSWFTQVSQGQAASAQLALVALVVVVSRWVVSVREVGGLVGLALLALVPPVLTGHSASSGSHDLAVVSMAVHVLAAVVWVGGVLALWWHLADVPAQRARAARRFSVLAAWCLGLVAVSGVVNAVVRVGGLDGLATTTYGRGALAKIVVLAAVAAVALVVRRRVVAGLGPGGPGAPAEAAPRRAGGPPARSFALLTGVELALMSAAFGLGVALSRTAPPAGDPYTSGVEAILGAPLPPEPTAARLLWSFNPSGIGLLVVLLGLVGYAAGVRTLRRRGDTWPVGRTIAFALGLALVAYCTVGGLGSYSHVLFSAHMVSHMVLSMVAPILLVTGAPISLALRALPGSDVRGGQGPRQILAAALASKPAVVLTHPVVTALMFVGSLYAIYFTGAFGWLMTNHLGHAWMEVHFLVTGFLFYESLVGIAPVPHRLPHLARIGMLLVVAPFHAFFSIALMSSSEPVGGDFYASLDRPYATDLLDDQYLGGSLAWAVGEIPILMVVIIVLFQWFRSDSREARQHDRREAASDDSALREYNERLARIRERDGS